MKRLMLSTALVGALVTPVMVAPAAAQDVFLSSAAEGDVRASDFVGKRLYASEQPADMEEYDGAQPDWQDIGEVNDVLLSRDGTVDAVLVDIGGFLGMGEHQVAVDMSQIKFLSDSSTADDPNDYFLVMTATKDILEAAPAYQDAAVAPATDAGADTAADTATAPAATDQPATDTAATTETDTAATTTETAPAAGTDAGTDTAATTADPATETNGFVAATPDQITTETLTGASVYDSTDAQVGEISELVLDANGDAQQAIVDVGGFLGIGEKPVALNISEVKIMKSADSDELRVYVDQTKEQLEAMPEYQKS